MSFFRPTIEAMAGYVPGEQPQAGKFIKLNTNENPYPPPRSILRGIEEVLEKGLQRYPDPMANAFRDRAAQLLELPSRDYILCGNGSDDILTICTRALVNEGDLLRLPTPSYILYRSLAQIQGARFEEISFLPDWSLPASFGQPAPELKLVFLPNPNSPTGTMISREAIVQMASTLPCPLLVDEAYADFADFNCVDLVLQHKNIMVSRTLSKSYGLAGLRFGYLIAQPELIDQMVKVKDSYNCDALSIAAATAAIDDTQWLENNRQKVLATRARLTEQLSDLGFTVIPSQANFVWCNPPKRGPNSYTAKELYEKLKADRVLVRYMNYAGFGDGLRISVGTDEQSDACVALLAQYLAERRPNT